MIDANKDKQHERDHKIVDLLKLYESQLAHTEEYQGVRKRILQILGEI